MPTSVVTIAAATATVREGEAVDVQLTRTGDTTDPLVVTISVGGTATESSDFAFIGTLVTIPAGKSSAVVSLAALADTDGTEGNETVVVTVASGMMDYDAGNPYQATVTIEDVPAVVGVTATDTGEGSATGGFTLVRTGGDMASTLKVEYTITGTATSGTDYEALTGSVTFAAGEDRVELPVEAFGDNLADDGETVILSIDTDSAYDIDSGADEATVTIADQALTVSVVRVGDGEEGGASGKFRFVRSGDLSEELTVGYAVTGTATSGTDFTSMSGTVTFEEDEDEVEVAVTITNDGSAEATETVTVTIDEPEEDEYLLGVESDTILIRDNDVTRVTWISKSSTDWGTAANWSTNAVPTSGQDVYFSGSGYANCVNAGNGLSALAGLHIVKGTAGR